MWPVFPLLYRGTKNSREDFIVFATGTKERIVATKPFLAQTSTITRAILYPRARTCLREDEERRQKGGEGRKGLLWLA